MNIQELFLCTTLNYDARFEKRMRLRYFRDNDVYPTTYQLACYIVSYPKTIPCKKALKLFL